MEQPPPPAPGGCLMEELLLRHVALGGARDAAVLRAGAADRAAL
eukprot:gene19250-33819_t